jgi:hypothetical protein
VQKIEMRGGKRFLEPLGGLAVASSGLQLANVHPVGMEGFQSTDPAPIRARLGSRQKLEQHRLVISTQRDDPCRKLSVRKPFQDAA